MPMIPVVGGFVFFFRALDFVAETINAVVGGAGKFDEGVTASSVLTVIGDTEVGVPMDTLDSGLASGKSLKDLLAFDITESIRDAAIGICAPRFKVNDRTCFLLFFAYPSCGSNSGWLINVCISLE